MKALGFQSTCFDTLSWNGTSGTTNNQIVLRGQGQKKIDSLVASWAPANGNGDPALLRTGRLLIVVGELSPSNYFIDPILPFDPSKAGCEKVIRDILTSVGTHKVIQLGELGVIIEPGATVSIIQTCMYISTDSNGSCSPTLGTLNIGAGQLYNDGNTNLQIKFR